jgi:hypothetical protein
MGGERATGETCRIGTATRLLNLAQATADPIVGAVSLSSARERLADALQRLPELSQRTRSLEPMGARAAGRAADDHERWFLDLDHEPLDGSTVRLMGDLGAGSNALSATRAPELPLVPLELDPLTVVDDRDFPEVVRAQPNLSVDLRRELPRLYGG